MFPQSIPQIPMQPVGTSTTPNGSPPTRTPYGSLPDPGTGSRNNLSAAPAMTDNVPMWAQNWQQAPSCPMIPTSFDGANMTPGHT